MTATPGASKRLGTAGNSEDGQVLGPKGTHKSRALTTASRSSFGTGPADTIAKSGKFYPDGPGEDVRGNQVQTILLADNAGSDTWVIQVWLDGTYVGVTAALDDDAAAATVQSELRSVIAGTDLTTVTVDSVGPAATYTVTFNVDEFYSRHYPKLVVVGTGMSGTVDAPRASQVSRPALGSSRYDGDGVGPGHALTGPAIGTITVTGGTDEVQTLTPGAGVDGGTVILGFRRGVTSPIAFDASVTAIQAAIDAAFILVDDKLSNVSGTDSPVVTISGTEVVTLDFGDMSTADTCKLTYGTTEGATTITYDVALTAAAVQAAVDSAAGAGVYVVARSSNLVYTLTKQSAGVGSAWSVTSTATFTPKATGGYVLGALITTAWSPSAGQSLWVFTFSRGYFDGKPVRGGLQVRTNAFTDGGVADTAAITVTTPGVLGSISAAYTELATYGDSILGVAVNDANGKEYSNGTGGAALLDAATPIVISGIPAGNYTLVCRTYDTESQRLGPSSTKTFVQT
jgi:hypothetical protein